MKNINDKTVVIITHEQPSMFYNVNVNFEAMNREGLRKILRGKCVTDEACEAAIDELLNLHSVSNTLPDHVVKFRLEELEMKYDYLMEQFNKLNDC